MEKVESDKRYDWFGGEVETLNDVEKERDIKCKIDKVLRENQGENLNFWHIYGFGVVFKHKNIKYENKNDFFGGPLSYELARERREEQP